MSNENLVKGLGLRLRRPAQDKPYATPKAAQHTVRTDENGNAHLLLSVQLTGGTYVKSKSGDALVVGQFAMRPTVLTLHTPDGNAHHVQLGIGHGRVWMKSVDATDATDFPTF